MVKPFSDAVFDQCKTVGEIVGPIKTQFGFHVIKLTGLGGGTKSYEEVKPQIQQTILLKDENLKKEQKKVSTGLPRSLRTPRTRTAFKALADKYKLAITSLPHPAAKDDSLGAVGKNPKLMEAVFKAPLNKWDSFDMTKESGAMKVFFKVTAVIPAHPATLDDMKADLEKEDQAGQAIRDGASVRVDFAGFQQGLCHIGGVRTKEQLHGPHHRELERQGPHPKHGQEFGVLQDLLGRQSWTGRWPVQDRQRLRGRLRYGAHDSRPGEIPGSRRPASGNPRARSTRGRSWTITPSGSGAPWRRRKPFP